MLAEPVVALQDDLLYPAALMQRNWHRLLRRLLLTLTVGFLIAVAPMPVWTPGWFLHWQVPAAMTLVVCAIGKLLIDTILFPRR
jgi:hypothetical protein